MNPRRRVGLVPQGGTIRCPNGHRVGDPLVWDHGGLRCSHKGTSGASDCGALMYLLGGGLRTPGGNPIVLVAEVKPEELHEMKRARMSWEEAVEFLGLTFLAAS